MPADAALGLSEGYGIELEYMIVDAETLDVRPIADRVLTDADGRPENEIERGAFAWSNELAAHVVEIKTNGPVAGLAGLAAGFSRELRQLDERLEPFGARLLPTAMHPWMQPDREFRIWPHGDREIYGAFDRIFDCRGHGWANLQSAHLNLSFATDEEFARLHAAVRALLPILPALAAASPFREGCASGLLDTRLAVYRDNARRVPSVSGAVVPEPVFARADYERLLEGIYADLAPHDPAGTLRHEWVNARGCIARFDRMALEIRVLDVQECPAADLAIAAAIGCVVVALCEAARAKSGWKRLSGLETERLAGILEATTARAEAAELADPVYLAALGVGRPVASAGDLWGELVAQHVAPDPAMSEHRPALDVLLGEGCLARRILRRAGPRPDHARLASTYRELSDCLRDAKLFRAAG